MTILQFGIQTVGYRLPHLINLGPFCRLCDYTMHYIL